MEEWIRKVKAANCFGVDNVSLISIERIRLTVDNIKALSYSNVYVKVSELMLPPTSKYCREWGPSAVTWVFLVVRTAIWAFLRVRTANSSSIFKFCVLVSGILFHRHQVADVWSCYTFTNFLQFPFLMHAEKFWRVRHLPANTRKKNPGPGSMSSQHHEIFLPMHHVQIRPTRQVPAGQWRHTMT